MNLSLKILRPCPALLGLLMLCGCGDDASAPPAYRRPSRPMPVRRAVQLAPPAPLPDDDPLIGSDPLAQGAGANGSDPLAAEDRLSAGPGMPTAHSHWVRGSVQNARATVSLNGVVLGQYTGLIDKDITMKLHSGVNTVTFLCHPLAANGTARLEVVESEHTPPIPPLATFRYDPPKARKATGQTDQRETFTFLAR